MKQPKQNKLFYPKNRAHYLGATEFGKYLGWDRKKVNVYYSRDQQGTLQHSFPEPIAYMGRYPMWTREQAKAYADHITKNNITKLGDDAEYWKEVSE